MNVKKLKEFRAKLVRAKKLCASYKFDCRIADALRLFAINSSTGPSKIGAVVGEVFFWYINDKRTPAERCAMWDNSIAAIDARIAKGK